MSGVHDDLATLREQLRHLGPWRGAVGDEALDRVETELARLRQERNEYAERLAWHREERDVYMKGNVWVRRAAEELERAETAERELARLREGLREIATTDLAMLRNPWGLMPDVVTAAADRVETELARLREGLRYVFETELPDVGIDTPKMAEVRALLADTPEEKT